MFTAVNVGFDRKIASNSLVHLWIFDLPTDTGTLHLQLFTEKNQQQGNFCATCTCHLFCYPVPTEATGKLTRGHNSNRLLD